MRHKRSLFKKISILTILGSVIICSLCLGTVYFWSYYYYGQIFEDRVIDEYTYKKNKELGVYNEWLLGASSTNIDLVEAVFGEEIEAKLYDKATSQEEVSQIYEEQIGDKYIIYRIDIDYENGDRIYKYSIIRDIYKESFSKILLYFVFFSIIIFGLILFFLRKLCEKLYLNIHLLQEYVEETSSYNQISNEDKTIDINDPEILSLFNSFKDMRNNLQEKDKFQQSMLQYISHEIKTPVMTISSYTEIAKQELYPKGTLLSTLDTISEQTIRITSKVEELLLLSKINYDYNNEEIKSFSLNNLILSVMEHIKYTDLNKDIKVILKEEIIIRGYRDKLKILCENLIDNQIKYSNHSIVIKAFVKKGVCHIYFYNDGEKIPRELSEKIFNPFVKGEYGNSGLGLSICKTIANLHNGNIVIKDTKIGTLFLVTIENI